MVSHPSSDKTTKIHRVFNFKFDFEEMKIINKIGKKININNFFIKMMNINHSDQSNKVLELEKKTLNYVSDYLLDFINVNCKHLSNINESKFIFEIK